MTLMKRFLMAALCVISVVLVPSSPAWAQETITLTNTGVEPDASGQATLAEVVPYTVLYDYVPGWPFDSVYYLDTAQLTVHCEGLTPGAKYRIGPTAVKWAYHKGRGLLLTDSYSVVTASATGTVDMAVQVTYISRAEYSHYVDLPGDEWDYWEVAYYDYSYELSVDRKQGSNYTRVLTGAFSP